MIIGMQNLLRSHSGAEDLRLLDIMLYQVVNSCKITHCFVWVLVFHFMEKTQCDNAEETGPKWEDVTGA